MRNLSFWENSKINCRGSEGGGRVEGVRMDVNEELKFW